MSVYYLLGTALGISKDTAVNKQLQCFQSSQSLHCSGGRHVNLVELSAKR